MLCPSAFVQLKPGVKADYTAATGSFSYGSLPDHVDSHDTIGNTIGKKKVLFHIASASSPHHRGSLWMLQKIDYSLGSVMWCTIEISGITFSDLKANSTNVGSYYCFTFP